MQRIISGTACAIAILMTPMSWGQEREVGQRPGQPGAGQQERQQPPGREGQPQRRTENTQRGGTSTNRAEGDTRSLATLLALGNRGEIEVSRLAAEKTNHADVRAFAEKMVNDHTEHLEKLQQFDPQIEGAGTAAAVTNARGDASRAADAAGREGRAAREQETPTRPSNRAATGARPRSAADSRSQDDDTLMEVARAASRMRLDMTKEMLQRYEGQDFDMGFLGQQIFAHTEMLSHLKAMKGKGTPDFQQLVATGIRDTEAHLQEAKELAKRLEDKEREGGRASDRAGRAAPDADADR